MTLPRIIFLDIDGVLTVKHLVNPRAAPRLRRPANTIRAFTSRAISHLNLLTRKTDALLVISSEWRRHGDVPGVLAKVGVTGQCHADWATDAEGPNRGAEIQRWLVAHGQPPYCVIDDWLPEVAAHASRVVHTDFRLGLETANVAYALSLFGLLAQ